MRTNVEYNLVGQFKADLYSGGKLVETTDFFPNFITNTGLTYPNIYGFADCFRFLSLGNGYASNSGTTSLSFNGTTGLANQITGFYDSNGNLQNVQWLGWQGYAPGFCGTVVSNNGPRFYRAWNIPTGTNNPVINDPNIPSSGLLITEFMVSPSSGADPSGACAFSRIQKTVLIPNGYSAIITYQLQILINNTGITTFPSGTFQTGNADISEDYELIKEWGNLSGYYRQIHFGLRCVGADGITFVPVYGDCMEPSTQYVAASVFYLSPDNSQFDVNVSGGSQTSINGSYSADGLSQLFLPNYLNVNGANESIDPSNPNAIYYGILTKTIGTQTSNNPVTQFRNLRIGGGTNPGNGDAIIPEVDNYTLVNTYDSINYQQQENYSSLPISYATPGITGYSSSAQNLGQQLSVSAKTVQLPLNTGVNLGQNLITGRYKMITRQSIFAPVSSLGWNTRFGSMVYALNTNSPTPPINGSLSPGNNFYYPYIDILFFDSSGRSTMAHYRYITGIYLTQRGSGILDCQLYLKPGNNTPQFGIPFHTFQGPYNSNGFVHGLTQQCDTINNNGNPLYWQGTGCCSGLILDGINLSSNAFGYTGITGDIYGNSGIGNGWGSIYGINIGDSFCNNLLSDLGILDHSLQNRVATSTGLLGWPYVLPFGTPVNLIVSGITYLDSMAATGIIGALPAINDTGNFFNGSNQIISNISLVPLTIIGSTPTPTGIIGFYPIPSPSYKNVSNIQSGFFITSGFFTGQIVSQNTFVTQNTGFSGFYTSLSSNIGSGDIWKGGTYSNISTGFSVLTTLSTISGFSALKVTGFFANIYERGYMGNNPLLDGQTYNVFFTGSGTNPLPLYITNILSASTTGPFTGYSLLSGTVNLTKFCPPTGYPEHIESSGISTSNGFRLLPNYGTANYYQSDVYGVTAGGIYPALSLDNSLQVFLDISWSSDSGTALNCCPIIAPF